MPKLLFAWLGSGRTRRSHVGPLGRFLDQTTRAGLPVPPGTVLLDELYQLAQANDLVTIINQRVVCPDPDSLHATIFDSLRLPSFDGPIVVRAIPSEPADRSAESNSLPEVVDSSDANQFCGALAAAWSELEQLGAKQRDVLLLETVAASKAGTAISMLDEACDQVYYTALEADDQRGRHEPPRPILKLHGWRSPDSSQPPHIQRLQMLLRGVRRTMGAGNWVVHWADDGAICWLLELRQMTAESA